MKRSKRSYFIRSLKKTFHSVKDRLRYKVRIESQGCYKFRRECRGKNNKVIIGEGSFIDNAFLYISGNNNTLTIGDHCYIGPQCSFRLEGNNVNIIINKGTTATLNVEFCAQEDNVKILVGEDCMFANTIVVRTSDSHPIYDKDSGERINPPGDVVIGNHVWVAPNCKIMKGSVIPDNCIVGSDTTVSKKFEKENILLVGRPAKIVKENVRWTRDPLF